MARVGYVIVCEDIFNDKEMIIKNPYNAITPYSVPGNFSFVLGFSLLELQINVPYKLKIEIHDEEGELVIPTQELDFKFSPPTDQQVQNTMNSGPVNSGSINMDFNNIVFKKSGFHSFSVTVNNEHTNEIQIPVRASQNI
ncbi:hypothetical protein ABEP17_03535 [Priestia flexa]|uniref:DUF6941 family protein n=1 Tax=Priestia flexa TaxID=86664 RepID=UPI003D2DDE16